MSRWSRTVLRVGLALLAGAALVEAAPARAVGPEPTRTIGGFEGTAAGSGFRVVYNPSGLLPIPPPVDLSAPDALATIASGPSTFARASIADPGDLLANPDALFAAGSEDYPAGAIPPYPFRISANSGSGEPSVRLAPAPGLESSVSAQASGSRADASTPRTAVPAIVTVGSARSRAATRTDGRTVTVEASSSLSDFDLLGMLTIASVSTELSATSDGTATTTSGGTVITGAELLGQPVTIDADGIHPQKGARGTESAAVKNANEALAALGLRVTVASPIQQESSTAGQLLSAGLRIDLEVSNRTYPQLGDVLDELPPLPTLVPGAPGPDDLLALARARHLLTVAVGQAHVTLGVRTAGSVVEDQTFVFDDVPLDGPGSGSVGFGAPGVPSIESPSSKPIGAAPRGNAASTGFATGIGAIALLGLLLQPLLADRISRGATILLASHPTDVCPREGT